jgi:hypothetical protein
MNDEAQANSPVESSPTSPASEPSANAEEKPVNQEAVQKRINDITAQRYEEKARADNAEKQLANLQAQQAQTPAAPAGEVPAAQPPAAIERPNPELIYDDPDEFNRQSDAYNEHFVSQAITKQQETAQTAERQRLESEAQQTRQAATERAMIENATTHNIDINELHNAAAILNQRGIGTQLGELMLQHPNSAPLVDYLAKNPGDFDQVNQMTNPYSIMTALNDLSPKALQRNISSAPDPVTGLTGLPAREGDEFDKKCAGAIWK